MTALLILSITLILSLTALQQARAAGDMAWEVRRADSLLAEAMGTAPRRLAASAGEVAGFAWTVETSPTGAEQPVALCRRTAVVESLATGRTFRAATLETCPVGGGG